MEELLGIAVRISFLYLYVLVILRLSGKRSIDTISSLDFIVALIIGDMFDDVFWAEIPLSQGVVGITTIIVLHVLVSVAQTYSTRIHNLVSSTPTLMIDRAAVQEKGMRRERTNENDLWTQLRILSEDDLSEVREAYLETSGQMSVLSTDAAGAVRKKDLSKVKEMVQK